MKVTKRIYDLLKENLHGLTIRELSDRLKVTRNTVAIGLAELRGEKVLEIRNVGKAKVHFISSQKAAEK